MIQLLVIPTRNRPAVSLVGKLGLGPSVSVPDQLQGSLHAVAAGVCLVNTLVPLALVASLIWHWAHWLNELLSRNKRHKQGNLRLS